MLVNGCSVLQRWKVKLGWQKWEHLSILKGNIGQFYAALPPGILEHLEENEPF
jgi:hypothetical protein